MISYKFRLYPEKEHEERLLETLEICRQTYNHFLAEWNNNNEKGRISQAGLNFNLSSLN